MFSGEIGMKYRHLVGLVALLGHGGQELAVRHVAILGTELIHQHAARAVRLHSTQCGLDDIRLQSGHGQVDYGQLGPDLRTANNLVGMIQSPKQQVALQLFNHQWSGMEQLLRRLVPQMRWRLVRRARRQGVAPTKIDLEKYIRKEQKC